MARFPKKSSTNCHVAGRADILVVFHNPPATPPTHTVLPVASDKSIHIARILPDVIGSVPGLVLPLLGPTTSLKGPLSCHDKGVDRNPETS